MLQTRSLLAGDLAGTFFRLDKGQTFPVHDHTPDDVHITIMLSGSARCTGRKEIEGKVLEQGKVYDWQPGEPHGWTALEDNTQWLNIIKKAKR